MKKTNSKWTGIIKGTNRGLVVLDVAIEGEDVSGQFSLFDLDAINIKANVQGKIKDRVLLAKVDNFQPVAEGNPSSGIIEGTMSEDNRELDGTWKTDIGTMGEMVLYQLTSTDVSQGLSEPKLTLETKELSVRFCTFDVSRVKEIFSAVDRIAKNIRKGRENIILPPIYSITYDAEESVRTYVLADFLSKLENARDITKVGIDFSNREAIQRVTVSFSYQPHLNFLATNTVSVSSTDKDATLTIAEMLRGMISKAKNGHLWCHQGRFHAFIQLVAMISMLAFSYMFSKKISQLFANEQFLGYGFIATLILLSTSWSYLSASLFDLLHKCFPVVEIINRPKSKIRPVLVLGVVASVFAAALIYLGNLVITFVF